MYKLAKNLIRNIYTRGSSLAIFKEVLDWYIKKTGIVLVLSFGGKISIDNPQEYIQGKILQEGIYEPEIAELLTRLLRPGDIFYDVGANLGVHAIVAAHCGARVKAFEPVPRIAAKLRKNIKINHYEKQITVLEMALAKESGEATIYVADRKDDGSHSLLPGVQASSITPINVEARTLDDFIADQGGEVPSVIKIDVEGAESLVLDGGSNIFVHERCPIFIIETADRLANSIGESAKSVLERLFIREYKVFRISWKNKLILEEARLEGISAEVENYLAMPKSLNIGSYYYD